MICKLPKRPNLTQSTEMSKLQLTSWSSRYGQSAAIRLESDFPIVLRSNPRAKLNLVVRCFGQSYSHAVQSSGDLTHYRP
jgi:hypothetical protein